MIEKERPEPVQRTNHIQLNNQSLLHFCKTSCRPADLLLSLLTTDAAKQADVWNLTCGFVLVFHKMGWRVKICTAYRFQEPWRNFLSFPSLSRPSNIILKLYQTSTPASNELIHSQSR